jgi:hypothetical protein
MEKVDMTNKVARVLAALSVPKSAPALITYTKNVVQSLTGNAQVPNPQPSVATIETALTDLEVAEANALARVRGAVATRNEKRTNVLELLQELKASVQKAADASPDQSTAIIQSTGLTVRKHTTRKPRVFSAIPGAVSGSVKIVAPSAGHRASYEWEWSSDGGKTWQILPATLQAKTIVPGLQPGSSLMFRYRSVVKTGAADWSQPVTLIVR